MNYFAGCGGTSPLVGFVASRNYLVVYICITVYCVCKIQVNSLTLSRKQIMILALFVAQAFLVL